MEYVINENGDRVILYVLAGADESIIGLKVHNCSIISMTVEDFYGLVIQTLGIQERNNFYNALISHRISIISENKLIILEIVEKEDRPRIFGESLLKMLKLYNSGDIYYCYFNSYRCKDGRISYGGVGKVIQYTHAIGGIPSKYSITESQLLGFPEWFDRYIHEIKPSELNDVYKAMLRAYDTSYLIGIGESEFIMLFSILEMIFGSGKTEITYQISRGTALLLSSNSDEMNTIYKRMKKLYNVRSSYVHDGKPVPIERLLELREIVRRVLIMLIDLNYHKKEKSFDDFRTSILLGGYHSFADKGEEKIYE